MRRPDEVVGARRAEAHLLRAAGLSYRAIGRIMDISHQAAWEMCNDEARARANQRRAQHYRDTPEIQEETKQRLQARRDTAKAAA